MTTNIQRASERGNADHGWLKAKHSFSFANWYDPTKMHFGAMRVLNDDVIAGGKGFGTHPHDNMEIVTLPLRGALAHKDSTGNEGVIKKGDVQIMSAGTGIRHSEYNASPSEEVNLFQIWVFPKLENIKPRYQQKFFDVDGRKNQWQIVVSPDENDGGVWINQDAVFALANLEEEKQLSYDVRFPGNGIYVMVISGSALIEDKQLNQRDAIEITSSPRVKITAAADTELLLIEVPMLS